jgi:hypothetical protein
LELPELAVLRGARQELNIAQVADELLRLRHDEAHQQRQRDRLRTEVESYERRYGLSSQEAEDAIADGRLRETFDVCRWMMAHDVLRRAEETFARR